MLSGMQTGRLVLVDGEIGHLNEIWTGVRSMGLDARVAKSVTEALRECRAYGRASLVLIGVKKGDAAPISRCRDEAPQQDSTLIAVGPSQEPWLRVQCFRAGAVDYIDVDASCREVSLRIGRHVQDRDPGGDQPHAAASLEGIGSRKYEIYRLAVQYLAETEIGSLTQQTLASRIGVSVGHLDAAFRDVLGCSVVQFLKRRRMDRAKVLLSGGNMSITAIAELLGFSDGANFATAFRQCVGVTPSEYRDAPNDTGSAEGCMTVTGPSRGLRVEE